MSKIADLIAKIKGVFNGMSKVRKISIGLITAVVIIAIVALIITTGKTKYTALFNNLDATDSQNIVTKLKEESIPYKVDNSTNTIMVPDGQVGQLRLQYAAEIKSGSIGLEIFDTSSQLGISDAEFNVKYQRALQGEIERTIKSFEQVEDVKVNIVLPEDSTFVKDTAPASVSITLKLKPGTELSEEQVRAIVSLVSTSVKNLPKENVQIVDNNMRLLTDDLFEGSEENSSVTASTQLEEKKNFENYLEEKILSQLESMYGQGRVKANVNAVLNFDSVSTVTTTVDKTPPIVSQNISINASETENTTGNSPVDNNLSNVISEYMNEGKISSANQTTNYNSDGKTTEEKVSALGKVTDISAAVAIDNAELTERQLNDVKKLVNKTIGQSKENEDDTIVMAYEFDPELKANIQKNLEAMEAADKAAAQKKLYTMIGFGAAALISLLVFAVVLRKRRSKKDELEMLETEDVILDELPIENEINFKPLDLEQKSQKDHVEDEIRKYAVNKPDQVAEIIKSWIVSDEG